MDLYGIFFRDSMGFIWDVYGNQSDLHEFVFVVVPFFASDSVLEQAKVC